MEILYSQKDRLMQKDLDLMTNNNDYFKSITYSTQKKDHFRIRRDNVAQIIKEVLDA